MPAAFLIIPTVKRWLLPVMSGTESSRLNYYENKRKKTKTTKKPPQKQREHKKTQLRKLREHRKQLEANVLA